MLTNAPAKLKIVHLSVPSLKKGKEKQKLMVKIYIYKLTVDEVNSQHEKNK